MHFKQKSAYSSMRNIVFSIIMFVIVFVLFDLGLNALSTRNHEEAQRTLTEALQRSIIHSYAVDGMYPESLEYILETYGITYDPEVFFVSYRALGANIVPELTVIVMESEQKGGSQ